MRLLTRKSDLAMVQTHATVDVLNSRYPEISCTVHGVCTRADKQTQVPVFGLGGKTGAFTHALEEQLLAGGGDIAVHSLKDLSAFDTHGLALGGFMAREDCRDVLVGVACLDDLKKNARLGTSSPRRLAQWSRFSDNVQLQFVRGNVLTRIKHVVEGRLDGVILAAAGLKRLGLLEKYPHCMLDENIFLPAFGQGIVAWQCLSDNQRVYQALQSISDVRSTCQAVCERSCLQVLGASCLDAVAGCCVIENRQLTMRACVYHPEKNDVLSVQMKGGMEDAKKLGEEVGQLLKSKGAAAWLC